MTPPPSPFASAEMPLRKRKRVQHDARMHDSYHRHHHLCSHVEPHHVHDPNVQTKCDPITTTPDTIATSTATTEFSIQSSSHSDTIQTDADTDVETRTPLALPSFVIYTKGLGGERRDEWLSTGPPSLEFEFQNTRLGMNCESGSGGTVPFWVSPSCYRIRQDQGDSSRSFLFQTVSRKKRWLFMNEGQQRQRQQDHDDDDCRQDFDSDQFVPCIKSHWNYDYDHGYRGGKETRNHEFDIDNITDFATALKFNSYIALANAERMHRIVENIRMDDGCYYEELDDYECDNDSEGQQQEDESSDSILHDDCIYEDLTLRYDFVKLDDFYNQRARQEHMGAVVEDCIDEEEVEEEEKEKYNLLEQDSYCYTTAQMIEYEREREFIVTQIEPACNEMNDIVDAFDQQVLQRCGCLADNKECNHDYDDSIKNRWYAQISSNIHGIYYYQPSTGGISRTEPFSYMDTSQVRCFGAQYCSTRENGFLAKDIKKKKKNHCLLMMSGDNDVMHLDNIAVDEEFVRFVSPMKQKMTTITTATTKCTHKVNVRGKQVLLFILLSFLAILCQSCRYVHDRNANPLVKQYVEEIATNSWQSSRLVSFPYECPFHEIDTCCENIL